MSATMNHGPVFVDTWGWLALGYRREPRHAAVQQLYRTLQDQRIPIYTSDYVLDELLTLLFRREHFSKAVQFVEGIFADVGAGLVVVERITAGRFTAAWQLRKRFQDKPRISFTDLTSMVVMQELGARQTLTSDDHFIQVGLGFSKIP